MKKFAYLILTFFLVFALAELGLRLGSLVYSHTMAKNFAHPDKINILCLGESTTFYGAGASYPSILQGKLDREYPNQFHVINGGVPGINTDYIESNIEETISEFNPQLTILMVGINDHASYFSQKKRLYEKFYLYQYLVNFGEFNRFVTKGANFPTLTNYLKRDEPIEDEILEPLYLNEYERFKNRAKQISDSLTPKQKFKVALVYYAATSDSSMLENIYPAIENNSLELSWIDVALFQSLHLQVGIGPSYARFYQKFFEDIIPRLKNPEEVKSILNHLEKTSASKLKEQKKRFKTLYELPETKKNITLVIESLKNSGSKVFLMQYPLRPISSMKSLFQADAYIGNDMNFRQALLMNKYEDLFVDRFAHDFGHTKEQGSELIAQSVFETIKLRMDLFN